MHQHHHHHHHHHHHDHGHHDHSKDRIGNIRIALFLNLAFAIIELIGGFLTGSVAIMADAVHDFGDSMALFSAMLMEHFSSRKPDVRYSYGYRRLSVLSALITSSIVFAGAIAVMVMAIPKLWQPTQPYVPGMLALAVLGIAVNGYGAWRVQRGSSLNERAISWHLFEDLLGWIAVFVGGLVMMVFDLPILDPILSIVFTAFVIWNISKVVRSALKVFLQATPSEVEMAAITTRVGAVSGVVKVGDLHVWSLDGEAHVITVNVLVDSKLTLDSVMQVKDGVRKALGEFGRYHSTIEIETMEHQAACEL
jgi:cobalt-zinc-cadmium efflux system protein